MQEQQLILASFIFFTLLVTAIGIWCCLIGRKKSSSDYLVASRDIPAWLAALSAVATNNSGFMFIGLIGYTYRLGLEAIWMAVGWIIGDFLAWLWVHPRIRIASEKRECNTISQLIGTNERGHQKFLIFVLGLLPLIFLIVYAAAQLKAGSTAMQTLVGGSASIGCVIGALIVLIYSFSGGIRASIWTDAIQSIIMFVSMLALVGFGLWKVGGVDALWQNLYAQDPRLMQWHSDEMTFGFFPYLLGMIAGGFGVIGQPHILVRFFAIESVEKIKQARRIYFAWFIPFFFMGIATGLLARAILPDLIESKSLTAGLNASQAAEFAMPLLSQEILPSLWIGLILAGLFSATISTADSQILICSGSVTQDLFPALKNSYLAAKINTLITTIIALLIALFANQGVFSLVLIAWSALGATLGPLLILSLYEKPASTPTSLLMIGFGLTGVLGWTALGYDGGIFKILPGFIAAILAYGIGKFWGWERSGKSL